MSLSVAAFVFFLLKSKFKVLYWGFGIFFLSIIFISLFFFKQNSSNGRMLIYKVTVTEVSSKEIIRGVGYGNFKVNYNKWQASYFSTRPAYTKEVIYAENTYFAFNDFFQFLIETGITGLVLLLCLFFFLAKRFHQQKEIMVRKPLLKAAWLCLISLCVSGFFFYTFQIYAVYPLLIFSLAIIFNNFEEKHDDLKTERIKSLFSKRYFATRTFITLVCVLIFISGIQALNFERKIKDATTLSRVGMKLKALEYLKNLENSPIWNESMWFTYAEVLFKLDKTDSALLILNKSAKHIYDDNTALLYANLNWRKGNFIDAERYYQEAINIIPKLYRHRFSLLNFYLETNQISSAKATAQYILSMPYESNQTVNVSIRKKTLEILNRINSQ